MVENKHRPKTSQKKISHHVPEKLKLPLKNDLKLATQYLTTKYRQSDTKQTSINKRMQTYNLLSAHVLRLAALTTSILTSKPRYTQVIKSQTLSLIKSFLFLFRF